MYIAILSQTGGTAQIKANFPNQYGGFGPPDILANLDAFESNKKKMMSEDDILDELEKWFNENLHCMENYKHIFEANDDFVKLNKSQRLVRYDYKNVGYFHQQKMINNHYRREIAKEKAEKNTEIKYYANKKNLSKWEDYRENKIELTAIFIKVLKRKNFTRRWLIWHKVG